MTENNIERGRAIVEKGATFGNASLLSANWSKVIYRAGLTGVQTQFCSWDIAESKLMSVLMINEVSTFGDPWAI